MKDLELYIFCCEYHWNHIVNKEPINKYIQRYTNLVYGVASWGQKVDFCFQPVHWKRTYEKNKYWALEMLEDNISYCEARLQIEKKKQENYADIQKRRGK